MWGDLSLEGEKKTGEVVDAVQASCNLRVCCPHRLGYVHRPASRTCSNTLQLKADICLLIMHVIQTMHISPTCMHRPDVPLYPYEQIQMKTYTYSFDTYIVKLMV